VGGVAGLVSVHIAMLSGEYPPRWGGMGSVVFHLASHLAKNGHTVTVITRKDSAAIRNPNSIPVIEGVKVMMVPWLKLPMTFTRSYGKNALKALKSLHNIDPVDVVHLHLPMISLTKKQVAKVRREIAPVVSSLHGSWLGERDGMRLAAKYQEAATWKNPNDLAILFSGKWYAGYEGAAARSSDICVANSHATKADFVNRYSLVSEKCEVVHWGVDTRIFRPLNRDLEEEQIAHEKLRVLFDCADEAALSGEPETNTPMILAVGRLVARKGFRTLLRAMPAVLEENPGARLVIVGRGHMKKTLNKQAEKLGVGHAIFIKSSLSFEDLAQLYRSADLVAYPSYYEGQGLIPLEAMASGTPVVTVNHGPLPEMVDDSVGSLFELGDIMGLSRAINLELANPQKRRIKGLAGRDRVMSAFTFDKNAEDFEKIYSSQPSE
jgi:glycosyltransferase involved in cell wall biosynthesis